MIKNAIQWGYKKMKLSVKSLQRLVKGALCSTTKNGYITFYRFGKNQLDYMSNEEYDYGWRNWAKFSGGIRIELRTDSEMISFDYLSSCQHERANTIDLYIDNILSRVYKIEDKLKGRVHFTLPKGEKNVTIYFPNESILQIKCFTIDGHYKSIKDTREKILAIGDSITQGAGPEFASVSYVNTLTREYKYDILNQGIGGYRFEGKDLMKIEGFEPDRIIVALGTNYYEGSESYDYEKEVENFFERLNIIYPDIKKLVITPIYRTRELDIIRFEWCRGVIKEKALRYKSTYVIDGKHLMPNDPVTLSDGVHPSTYGSVMISRNLIKFMKEIKF